MKSTARALLGAGLALGLGACTPKADTTAPAPAPPAASAAAPSSLAPTASTGMAAAKPINVSCPVLKGTKVDPKITYEYKGKLYAFCCSDCLPQFKASPEKFLANWDPNTPVSADGGTMNMMGQDAKGKK